MTYDLDKVLKYGQKIGAEQALILNDKLSRYYKKGDKASKYCAYSYANHDNGRPLRWEMSGTYHVDSVAEFYKGMGHKVEIIEIPESDIELIGGDNE